MQIPSLLADKNSGTRKRFENQQLQKTQVPELSCKLRILTPELLNGVKILKSWRRLECFRLIELNVRLAKTFRGLASVQEVQSVRCRSLRSLATAGHSPAVCRLSRARLE